MQATWCHILFWNVLYIVAQVPWLSHLAELVPLQHHKMAARVVHLLVFVIFGFITRSCKVLPSAARCLVLTKVDSSLFGLHK